MRSEEKKVPYANWDWEGFDMTKIHFFPRNGRLPSITLRYINRFLEQHQTCKMVRNVWSCLILDFWTCRESKAWKSTNLSFQKICPWENHREPSCQNSSNFCGCAKTIAEYSLGTAKRRNPTPPSPTRWLLPTTWWLLLKNYYSIINRAMNWLMAQG